jgi:Zn-finger protein
MQVMLTVSNKNCEFWVPNSMCPYQDSRLLQGNCFWIYCVLRPAKENTGSVVRSYRAHTIHCMVLLHTDTKYQLENLTETMQV